VCSPCCGYIRRTSSSVVQRVESGVVDYSRESGVLHKVLIAFSGLKETCVEQSGFYEFDLT
jgi:hypothetical protein